MQQKHDIPANWEKSSLIPLAGEVIVYDSYYIDDQQNKVVVAPKVRFKIGDGVTLAKDLPFSDSVELSDEIIALAQQVSELDKGISTLTPVDDSIILGPINNKVQTIQVAIAPVEGNALQAVDGGLFVPSYTAGNGIELVDKKIQIKLAKDTHGLTAVDGALAINLATKDSDGALSKEDKQIIDSLPYVYETRKYEISDVPAGTLVDYSDYEIRIMCPKDAEFKTQAVGENGNPNLYYMTFKAYAPKDAVSFKEGDRGVIIDEMLTFDGPASGIDEFGRCYSVCWLPLASYNSNTNTWTYFGKNSNETKYTGWDYCVEWYNKYGIKIGYDNIRINLSNENCHQVNRPYYLSNYATMAEMQSSIEQSMTWSTI